MNKNPDSPFSKVTSLIATKDGEKFYFDANNEDDLLISSDVLSRAISFGDLENKTDIKVKRSIRPIIGISSDSFWTLELLRRYLSKSENRFISISKVVELHTVSLWSGDSDLNEYGEKSGIKSEKLMEAYNSLRRLVYVKADNDEKIMEFRVPELTNSYLPIWRSAMLCLFQPSLLVDYEISELIELSTLDGPLDFSGKTMMQALHEFLISQNIDFHKINEAILKKRKLLIDKFEAEKTDSNRSLVARDRMKSTRKYEDHYNLEKNEINVFNKRFKNLQKIAKKQGILIKTK